MLYQARQLKIPHTEQLQYLAHEAGVVYSLCLVTFWRVWRKKHVWLSKYGMQKLIKNRNLHSQTTQGIIDMFYTNIESWRKARKINPNARMPRCRKWYFAIPYKTSAIKLKDGVLTLSNGKGNAPLRFDWPYDLPKHLTITFDKGYRINAIYTMAEPPIKAYGEACGIDLGEIHPAVAHTGNKTIILNGRKLRCIRQYRNKALARFQAMMSKCKKGSKRHKKLAKAKKRVLKRLDNQIKDVLHKQTTKLVFMLQDEGVKTVVIGYVRDIRQRVDVGHRGNQTIHQMPTGKTRFMLTYKCKRVGIEVVMVNEAYSSQTCPACLHRHKPHGRVYRCPNCGFVYHRDGVGAVNIRNKYKYREYVPVVGVMTPPLGIRYTA